MKTLFIDRKNSELEIDNKRLIVRIAGSRPQFSLPLGNIETVVISAPVQLSSTLLCQLTQAGITLVAINPRQASASTFTHGLLHNDARRRLQQYQAVTDDNRCLHYARELIGQKVRGQRHVLLRAGKMRPDCRLAISTACDRLEAAQQKIATCSSIESLRGQEGAAAASYFEAFQTLFAGSLQFNGRNRRPPKDPVNVVLSLSYTLLHSEAVRALCGAGFDPFLGFFHDPAYARESLACDLVELFRPLVDYWVWRLFAEQRLTVEHFKLLDNNTEQPCLLGKAGREHFYQSYSLQGQRYQRLLRRICRHWLKRLQQDNQGESHGNQ